MSILVVLGVRFLEGMFIVGALGSVVVLVLSGIEDLETLFGMDDKEKKSS
jgi:hypothetical protein